MKQTMRPDGLENAALSPPFRTSVGPAVGLVEGAAGGGVVLLPDEGKPSEGLVISEGSPAVAVDAEEACDAGAGPVVAAVHPESSTATDSIPSRPHVSVMRPRMPGAEVDGETGEGEKVETESSSCWLPHGRPEDRVRGSARNSRRPVWCCST